MRSYHQKMKLCTILLIFNVKVGVTNNEVCKVCVRLEPGLTTEELEVDVTKLLAEPLRATGC